MPLGLSGTQLLFRELVAACAEKPYRQEVPLRPERLGSTIVKHDGFCCRAEAKDCEGAAGRIATNHAGKQRPGVEAEATWIGAKTTIRGFIKSTVATGTLRRIRSGWNARAGSRLPKQTPRGLTLLSMVEPDWRRRLGNTRFHSAQGPEDGAGGRDRPHRRALAPAHRRARRVRPMIPPAASISPSARSS